MLENMGQIMSQIQKAQDEIKKLTVEVECPDGLMKVVMNGKQEITSVTVNAQAIHALEVDKIENSMVEVLNKAVLKSREAVKEKLSHATGMNLDGLTNIFK